MLRMLSSVFTKYVMLAVPLSNKTPPLQKKLSPGFQEHPLSRFESRMVEETKGSKEGVHV